jgi:hypothetical protein
VEKALAGVSVKEPGSLDAIETKDQEIQASILFFNNVILQEAIFDPHAT